MSEVDPDLLDVNLTNATELLFRKSGALWSGSCTETVRPVSRSWLRSAFGQHWWQSGGGSPFVPDLVDGTWFNLPGAWDPLAGWGPCLTWDSGHRLPQFDLGQYPVTAATVKIDGAALDPAAYRIDGWHLLTRTDGDIWPINNDLLKPDSAAGTWSVAVTYGVGPPQMGVTACAVLAAELTRHCLGDQRCALPLRVTGVSRQGVTYSLANVQDLIDKGRTGLFVVDLFLQTVNPDRLDRPARVLTADIRAPRRLG